MTVQDSICPPTDLTEADRLVADLAALLDAGLVAVQENLLGPARYGVVSELDDQIARPSASPARGIPLRRRRPLM
jgi:hypothetical protein